MTPGLDLLATIGNGPIRGIHVTAGTLYVVSGSQIYSVNTNYQATLVGSLGTSSGPVSIIDNGNQTLFFDGNSSPSSLTASIVTGGSGGNSGTYSLPIPAPPSGGAQAVGTFTISNGVVVSVDLTNTGTKYSSNITLTNAALAAVPGVGSLTGAEILLTAGGSYAYLIGSITSLQSVTVSNTGGTASNSYAPGDTITLAGGAFTNQASVQVLTTQVNPVGASGAVNNITLTTQGSGLVPHALYRNIPATGGTGSGATFNVQVGGLATVVTITVNNPGSGYSLNDLLTLPSLGGMQVTVLGLGSVQIVQYGSGGTPGPTVLTGTTGAGEMFQFNGTIDLGGALQSIDSYPVLGAYTTNPTNLSNEPVTATNGLTGVVLSITMGVATASVTNGGSYSSLPSTLTQASTTGNGLGVTFTPTWNDPLLNQIFPISLPFSAATSASYQDGFGLCNEAGTQQWWQSNLDDLSMWDPLNFSSADAAPDNIVAVADVHREVWLIKEFDAEIWINGGLSGFAFQRLDGVYIEKGCLAPFSVARAGDSLLWLAQSKEGQAEVVITSGYNIVPISTHALQYALEQYPTLTDAIGYTYQQEGHTFYVLTFPSGNATWVYDITTSREVGQPMWAQRAAFVGGQFQRHQGNCYALFNNQNIIGDYQSGNLYAMNLNNETDAGAQRKWLRSWRALQEPQEKTMRFDSLRIDMQTGIGVSSADNPQCQLRWSDDGGWNWSNPMIRPVGKIGETARRVMFKRMGSTRRNSGLDRLFELSSTDQFGVALIGAVLNE